MKKKRAEEKSSARKYFGVGLELEFQGELNLTRRTLVAVGEASSLNDTEGAASDGQDRVAKVGMV